MPQLRLAFVLTISTESLPAPVMVNGPLQYIPYALSALHELKSSTMEFSLPSVRAMVEPAGSISAPGWALRFTPET